MAENWGKRIKRNNQRCKVTTKHTKEDLFAWDAADIISLFSIDSS
jgi:hypothetical protein